MDLEKSALVRGVLRRVEPVSGLHPHDADAPVEIRPLEDPPPYLPPGGGMAAAIKLRPPFPNAAWNEASGRAAEDAWHALGRWAFDQPPPSNGWRRWIARALGRLPPKTFRPKIVAGVREADNQRWLLVYTDTDYDRRLTPVLWQFAKERQVRIGYGIYVGREDESFSTTWITP